MAFGLEATGVLTVTGDFQFIKTTAGAAIAVVLQPGETAKVNVWADAAGTTDNIEIEVLQGFVLASDEALDGASAADTLELNSSADSFASDDELNGTYLVMTSGDEEGEGALIEDSQASNDQVTLLTALSGTPSASETYSRYLLDPQVYTMDLSAAIDDDTPHNLGIPVDSRDGQVVMLRARRTGSTDSHLIRVVIFSDGVSL